MLENQTSTDYYFITDFRGWVWGLTDDSGTIVESYNYDPFGRILAGSLLSHARFLSGAHEGQWRHRYIYCQNDPVALIDPTGYSPENTGTPPRFTLGNIGNHGTAATACLLPDMSKRFSPSSLLWWGDHSPGEGSINCSSSTSTNNQAIKSAYYHIMFQQMGGTIEKNADGSTTYSVEIDGEQIWVTVRNGQIVSAVSSGTIKGDLIAQAINDAAYDIDNRGGSINNIPEFLVKLRNFTQNHYVEWNDLGNSECGKNAGISGNLYDFVFHATRGIAISNGMSKTGVQKYDQYDESFGFWTSFVDKRDNMKLSFGKRNREDISLEDTPTIYDYADVCKSIAFQESSFNTGEMNDIGYGGLMGTRGWKVQGKNPDFIPFMGIGHGVTHFAGKVKQSMSGKSGTPNMGNIKKALGYYYGYYNDSEGDATVPPDWYITQVWANFNRIRRSKPFKRYKGGNNHDVNSGEVVIEYQN